MAGLFEKLDTVTGLVSLKSQKLGIEDNGPTDASLLEEKLYNLRQVIDADNVAINRKVGERFSPSFREASSTPDIGFDAWETRKDDKWLADPQNFKKMGYQKAALAKLKGVRPEEVTKEDVFKQGELATKAAERILLEGQILAGEEGPLQPKVLIRPTGKVDEYGRPLTGIFNPVTGKGLTEELNTPNYNAAFFAPYNRRANMMSEADPSAPLERSWTESLIQNLLGAYEGVTGKADIVVPLIDKALTKLGILEPGEQSTGAKNLAELNKDIEGLRDPKGQFEALQASEGAAIRDTSTLTGGAANALLGTATGLAWGVDQIATMGSKVAERTNQSFLFNHEVTLLEKVKDSNTRISQLEAVRDGVIADTRDPLKAKVDALALNSEIDKERAKAEKIQSELDISLNRERDTIFGKTTGQDALRQIEIQEDIQSFTGSIIDGMTKAQNTTNEDNFKKDVGDVAQKVAKKFRQGKAGEGIADLLSGMYETIKKNPQGTFDTVAEEAGRSLAFARMGNALTGSFAVDLSKEASNTFREEYNRNPTAGEQLFIDGISLLNSTLDKVTDKLVVDQTMNGLSQILKTATTNKILLPAGLLGQIGLKIGGAKVVEGVQESAQSVMEDLAAYQDWAKVDIEKAITEGAIGAVAGGGMVTGGMAANAGLAIGDATLNAITGTAETAKTVSEFATKNLKEKLTPEAVKKDLDGAIRTFGVSGKNLDQTQFNEAIANIHKGIKESDLSDKAKGEKLRKLMDDANVIIASKAKVQVQEAVEAETVSDEFKGKLGSDIDALDSGVTQLITPETVDQILEIADKLNLTKPQVDKIQEYSAEVKRLKSYEEVDKDITGDSEGTFKGIGAYVRNIDFLLAGNNTDTAQSEIEGLKVFSEYMQNKLKILEDTKQTGGRVTLENPWNTKNSKKFGFNSSKNGLAFYESVKREANALKDTVDTLQKRINARKGSVSSSEKTSTPTPTQSTPKTSEEPIQAPKPTTRVYDNPLAQGMERVDDADLIIEENKPKQQESGVSKDWKEKEITINDKKVRYLERPRDSNRPLATTSKGKDGIPVITVQEGITGEEVYNYLSQDINEMSNDNLKNVIADKQEVNILLEKVFGIKLPDYLKNLSQADLTKFLVAHETRHLQQINKRKDFDAFLKEYRASKENAIKFELDANKYALRIMGVKPLKGSKKPSEPVKEPKPTPSTPELKETVTEPSTALEEGVQVDEYGATVETTMPLNTRVDIKGTPTNMKRAIKVFTNKMEEYAEELQDIENLINNIMDCK